MDRIVPIINDLTVIIFDLIIFTNMISLKRDTKLSRAVMYIGCTLIVLSYYVAAYVLGWAASIASMVCMSIPSLILFYILSYHKDCRFIMTFSFVDSVSLIVAFIGRYIGMVTSQTVGLVSAAVTIGLFSAILFIGKDYFKKYHDLLEVTQSGWTEMAVSTVMIYFGLVFFAAYPKPLVERMEYAPVYLVFSIVVVSFYVVFIKSIIKTRQIYEQNKKLEYEKKIYQIAYRDALTGLLNRASYIECVNRLERRKHENGNPQNIACMMFDLNDLKQINDRWGHSAGDRALTGAAAALKRTFVKEKNYIFRLGGDEFCALITDCSDDAAKEYLVQLKKELEAESLEAGFSIRLAAGYEMLKNDGEDTIETALNRADNKMYEDKKSQKSKKGHYD